MRRPTLVHPRTGEQIRPLGMFRGRPIWPILGAEDNPPSGGGGGGSGGNGGPPSDDPPGKDGRTDPPRGGKGGDHGYPADTPLEQMSAEQREAYWKHQARKHEDRNRAYGGVTPEQVRTLTEEAERRRREQLPADQQALEKAKDDVRAELRRSEVGPARVEAAFARASAGRLDPAVLDGFLEDVDLARYLNDDGTVNTDKVTARVASLAGANGGNGGRGGRTPDLGQGRRGGQPLTGREQGLAEAERRFGKRQTSTT